MKAIRSALGIKSCCCAAAAGILACWSSSILTKTTRTFFPPFFFRVSSSLAIFALARQFFGCPKHGNAMREREREKEGRQRLSKLKWSKR